MLLAGGMLSMFNEYVAIDPMALMFPTSVYLKLVEKYHPNEPPTAHLGDIIRHMTPEQRAFVAARISTINAFTGAVAKAMGQGAVASGG